MKPQPILLRGLPLGGYPKTYRATISTHKTAAEALSWGHLSGLAAVPGGPFKREGRLWIEKAGEPATLAVK